MGGRVKQGCPVANASMPQGTLLLPRPPGRKIGNYHSPIPKAAV